MLAPLPPPRLSRLLQPESSRSKSTRQCWSALAAVREVDHAAHFAERYHAALSAWLDQEITAFASEVRGDGMLGVW